MNEPTLAGASLRGLCPRCASPTLFQGPIKLSHRCRSCGLDYDDFNIGDGPAVFLILIIGTIVAAGAIWLELAFTPPWWVHIMWLPISIGLTMLGLRIGKGALMFQEYKHRAGEGQVRK